MSAFIESQHPRGQAGKFTAKAKFGAAVGLDSGDPQHDPDSSDLSGWLARMSERERGAVNRFLDKEARTFGSSRDWVLSVWDDSEGIAFDESRHVGEALAETHGPDSTFDIVHEPSGVPIGFRVSQHVGDGYEITRRYPSALIGDDDMTKADHSSREGLRIYASAYESAFNQLELNARKHLR